MINSPTLAVIDCWTAAELRDGGLTQNKKLSISTFLSGRLPEDKSHLYELMNNSQACFILLYLKSFLMKLYGFTEALVFHFSKRSI